MTHRHFTEHGHDSGNRNYNITKYCLDELIRTHDFTIDYDDEDTDTKNSDLILDFAYICIPPYNLKGMLDDYIYPISLSFSIMCFLLFSSTVQRGRMLPCYNFYRNQWEHLKI